jgi:ATP/maltotriose-dependent transcriptional regulator MalT
VSPRISSPTLVGRGPELAALEAALAEAAAGRAGACVLAGEAGIGKTRLADELEARARDRGFAVLRGACVQLDGGELPFGPLATALRHVPVDVLEPALAALPADGRATLARAFPVLGPAHGGSGPDPADALSQVRLFAYLTQLLAETARDTPLLLVLDDLQWADPSTSDVVRSLAGELRDERLALVLTYRTGELGPDHPVRRMVAGLRTAPRVRWIDLSALTAAEVADLVAGVAGTRDAALAEAVHVRSGGNPFFAEELIAAAGDGDGALPASLVEALLARVRRLPEPGRDLLQALAVAARPAPGDLAGAAAGVPEPALSRALRAAVDQHLLELDDDGEFRFRHAVVREAVETDLLPGERRALHAAVAHALAHRLGEPSRAELAVHWIAAGRTREAFEASVRAALEAERARAFAAALQHLEAALERWDAAGPDADTAGLDRVDALARAADLAKSVGAHERAIGFCEQALGHLDPGVDARRAAAFHERLGRLQSFAEDCGLGAYRRALELVPADARVDRARLLTAEGYALWGLHRYQEAIGRCEDALAVAREAGADGEAAYAEMVLGLALGHAGDPDGAERHLRHALAVPADRLDPAHLLYGHVFLGEVLRVRGDVAGAAAVMADGERHAHRLGLEAAFGRFLALNAALDAFHLGRWDEAQERLDALAGADMEPWDALLRDQVAGRLHLARGALDEAEAELRRARAIADGGPSEYLPAVYAGLAELELARGRPAAARAWVDAGTAALGDRGDVLYAPVLFATGARVEAELAVADGASGAAAERVAGHLARLDALLAADGGGHQPPAAAAHRASAAAELQRARGADATAAWEAAAAAWDALGAAPPAAYARWRAADALLLAGGERRRALRLLQAAHETAARLRARSLREDVEGLARRARLPLEPAPAPEPVADAAVPAGLRDRGLTARELEVLALVGEGLTNRQIGERLFISPKTAGLHVSHILAKLGTANRTQAADVAHRSGLVAPVGG